MENKNITIKDIAKMVGVSVATVSRIINNKDQEGIKISPETKKKVLKAVKDHNYRPNLMAKSLIMNKSFIIGVIVPDLIGTFFPEVIQGIEEVIQAKGYNLILSNTMENHDREKREIEILRDRRVDGLIIVPTSVSDVEYYRELKDAGVKFIFLDRYVNDNSFDYVISDDETGAYEMVTYLIKQNYKKIGFIKGSNHNTASINRLNGYKKALYDHNIDVNKKLIYEGGLTQEEGYSAMMKILNQQKNDIPEVIFGVNDPVAIGVLKAVKEKKLKIPKDIGVAGYANDRYTDLIDPGLTTMSQPKSELGKMAAEMLINQIDEKESYPRQIKLGCQLIIRNSCRK